MISLQQSHLPESAEILDLLNKIELEFGPVSIDNKMKIKTYARHVISPKQSPPTWG